jgi:hypothetical protein
LPTAFGHELVPSFVGNSFNSIERLACGIPVGFSVFSWLVYLISFNHSLTLMIGIMSCLVLTFLTLILMWKKPREIFDQTISIPIKSAVMIVYGTFVVVAMLKISIFAHHTDFHGTIEPDIGLHWSLIMSFVIGCNSRSLWLRDFVTPFYASCHFKFL